MQISVSSTPTIYRDGQFWVGIVEHVENGAASVARIVFGAEPSGKEVMDLVLGKWGSLRFAGKVDAALERPPVNPKRRQREASKQLAMRGTSTKAQMALAQAREERKEELRTARVRRKREMAADRFSKRMAKKKEKRRGHYARNRKGAASKTVLMQPHVTGF